jgi:GTP cyclohydrolase IA
VTSPSHHEQERAELVENAVHQLIGALGYDVNDQHFVNTPTRVYRHLAQYVPKPVSVLDRIFQGVFEDDHQEMVAVVNIPFHSMCAHHLLTFRGKAHVAYIPDGHVLGLSKLARVLYYFATRLTLQEHVTGEIADTLMERLDPKGVAVVLDSEHQCMTVRGVRATGSSTVTSAMRGVFLENDKEARSEFFALVRGNC